MNRLSSILAGVGFLIAVAAFYGCGTNDPLSTLGDPNPPALEPIFSGPGGALAGAGYSTGHTYWEFSTTVFFYGQNVLAPAKGVVSSLGLDSTTGTSFVTIAHAGRLSTRIAGIVPTVRAGDSVVSGQIIGTFVGSGLINFQVLLNGTPMCPLSFISTSFRQSIVLYFTGLGSNLCI